jgi:superfamily II DNA or RNA helicase
MEITEKWLGDIGGWQALKTAREYVRLGSVKNASREGDTFRGLVGEGRAAYKTALIVHDHRRVDCQCGCPDARRGLICAHSVAVALYDLQGAPAAEVVPHPSSFRASPNSREAESKASLTQGVNAFHEETVPTGRFTVQIHTDRIAKLPLGTIPIFLRFERGGEEKEIELARWLYGLGLPCQTATLQLGAKDFAALLIISTGHNQILNSVSINKTHNKLLVKNGLNINVKVQIDKQTQQALFKYNQFIKPIIYRLNDRFLIAVSEGELAWFEGPTALGIEPFLSELNSRGSVCRPLQWVAAHLADLRQILHVEGEDDPLKEFRLLPADPVAVLNLEGSLRHLEAQLSFKIGTQAYNFNHLSKEVYPAQDESNHLFFYTRNLAKEQSYVQRLLLLGFQQVSPGAFELKGEDAILKFYSTELSRLKSLFTIVEGERWKVVTHGLAVIRPQLHRAALSRGVPEEGWSVSSGQDWLSLQVAYEAADGFRLPRGEVLRLIRSGKRDFKARDGRRFIVDLEGVEELEESLQDVGSQFQEGGSRLRVRSLQAGVLGEFAAEGRESLELSQVEALSVEDVCGQLSGLGSLLRPYQLEGVRWMERLGRMRAGGLLADEMGLGKTVQTLALIRMLLSSQKVETCQPVLVVCPTSLLSNWSEEAKRFVPDLKTHISHEGDRHQHFKSLSKYNIIFTSYALVVRDLKHLIDITFTALILDEASFIRNPDTATAKAVRSLSAQARFALTGTPVENSVKDLWSLFEFALPGCLPERDAFQERFVKPLSQPDAPKARAVMERLRRLVKPYVLRRTKREVAKDLPEKIEKVLWCDLTSAQREVYQRLLDEGREEIRQAQRRSGKGASRMTMFTVLLRLRQTCNDLRLLKLDVEPEVSSGKWPMLEEAFTEIVEGGHKALIFSQFVGMLHLIRDKAEALGLKYCYLDGSSTDRAEQVATFQQSPEKTLFLISLKAGGYGLNLTAADTVFLVDPWWNPAVEAQAIDRAHRIGQGRPVTAYRLVTRGTVEEKILKLQAQKRAVMDMAFDDDMAVMAGLTDDELENMLN